MSRRSMIVQGAVVLAALAAVALFLTACPRGSGSGGGGHAGHDHGGHDHGGHEEEGGHGEGEEAAHAGEAHLTAEAIQRAGVRTEKAARVALVPTYRAPARVALDLDAMAHVGVPVRGRVRELRVKRGDVVEKGTVLFILDSPELGSLQNELLEKRVAAETVAPSVEIAKSAYERAKRLLDANGNMTLTEVQRREAEWKTAEAALITARASVSTAENALHLLGMSQEKVEKLVVTREIEPTVTVTAPISGSVLERDVTLGEIVSPEQESLIVLGDTSVVWVFAHVPEQRLGEVRKEAPVRLHVAALPGRVIEGRIAAVPPKIDEGTRSAELRVDVKDAGGLRPGMYAQAEIVMGEAPAPVLAIPDTAVQTIDGVTCVFVPVEGEQNAFKKRPLRLGDPIGRMLPVLEGLAEGEAFVSTGTFLLKAELGKATAEHEH